MLSLPTTPISLKKILIIKKQLHYCTITLQGFISGHSLEISAVNISEQISIVLTLSACNCNGRIYVYVVSKECLGEHNTSISNSTSFEVECEKLVLFIIRPHMCE